MDTSLDPVPLTLRSSLDDIVESDCACASDTVRPLLQMLHLEPDSDCACSDGLCIPENDCACPDDGWAHITHALDGTIVWQRAPVLYRAPLSNEYELALNPLGAGVTVLNAPARRIFDTFAQSRTLPQAIATLDSVAPTHVVRAVREFIALGLLRPVGVSSVPSRAQPRTLTAWLHITNACNLRCAYCYVTKTNAAMDESTGIAAINAIFRSALAHGFRAVKLKYAGGEPTLNFALVTKLHTHARHLADALGLELREVILSNGVALTEAMLDTLREARMRVMLSLDGVGATNDTQRPSAEGHSSYARIVRTIDRARARGITPYLSITVTAQNAAHLGDIVALALGRELPFNLNFVRHPSVSNAILIQGVRAAFAVIQAHLPKYSLLGVLDRARLDQPHAYPCGVGQTYVVIDQRGRIALCQMTLTRTVGDVWHDDPLIAVQSARDAFENVSVEQKDGCRDCTWKYWCAGGCPLLTFKSVGQSNASSPYCEAYTALYPELVRLEGLRLLQRQPN